MSYPEFSDFPPIPQRSAAEADFDTKMSALFQHFATTHRAEMIALIDFLKTGSTIIGGALNATTVGLDTPAEGKFTALEAPQLDLINAVSGVLAVLGASASDLNIGTNSNHPVDLRVAGIRSILLSTNGTKSFYNSSGATVGVTMTGGGDVGIGETSPDDPLVVARLGASRAGVYPRDLITTILTHPGGDASGSGSGITVAGNDTSICKLLFSDTSDGDVGGWVYHHGVDEMTGRVNGFDAIVFDSLGNVGLGTGSPSAHLEVKTPDSGIGLLALNTGANNNSVGTFRSSNTGFTNDVMRLVSDKTANADFEFLTARSAGGADKEFVLRGDGAAFAEITWNAGGADYAEYFEWADGNPGHEDRRGLSVVLDGDKIRPALPGEEPIGVISANPSVVGDGDIDRWKGKYLRDAFGAYIWEDYEALNWSEVVTETETVQEQASEAQERTREVIEVVDGIAVKRTVTETVQVPLFDEFPLVDEAGQPIMVATSETLADGSQNIIEVQAIHREPRMVEVQRQTTRDIEHSYAADEVPDGVAVPADAERVTQQRRTLNPEYDPSQEYTPRADRPEWDTVGLMGKLRLLKGQPTGARWIKMRDVSADVEEWLVR